MQTPMSRENMIRGVMLFTLFTLVGLFLSFVWSGTQDIKSGAEDLKQVFLQMRYKFLIGTCVCMFVDWLCAGLRFHIFVRIVTPTIRVRDSFRALLATLCVSAITPFQTGGVGHLYIYARSGVPLSGAITAGIVAFLSTLVILILSAGGILLLDPSSLPEETTLISLLGFVIFGLVFTTFLLLLFKPAIVLRIFNWFCNVVGQRFKPVAPFLKRATSKVEQLITEHKTFATTLLRHHKLTCVLSLVLTCGFFSARIVGSYFIVKALNGNVSLWDLGVVGMLLNFVVLFMPTPGASGFAEGTTSLLMRNLISGKSITPFVLLTRFFTVYCAVVIGGIIIGLQLAKDLERNKKGMVENAMPQVQVRPIGELKNKKGHN
ncbi:flippase-like domain-containing protein [Candidatus Poribacteria bacterium]|nr:flippase-like domain-containing protein [Candidatus Poribacteria bacterium]